MEISAVEYLESPAGLIKITADDFAVHEISFVKEKSGIQNGNSVTALAVSELNCYFIGQLKEFTMPLAFVSGSGFQQRVWKELQSIPFGKTISYLTLARRLGDEKCIRAAALANGKNPFAIVVPCHRVIGTNGSLTGYAGGIEKKAWLLNHEQGTRELSLFDQSEDYPDGK